MINIKNTFFAFGTVNTIEVWVEEERKEETLTLLSKIKVRQLQLHQLWNVFDPKSELSQINQSNSRQEVSVSKDTWNLLQQSKELNIQTRKKFDITLRNMSSLWKFDKKEDEHKIPSDLQLWLNKRKVGMESIKMIRREGIRKVYLKKRGQSLDFGGIAKGYAIHLAEKMLKEEGVEKALLNFGGTVTVLGDWKKVGVQHPFKETGESMGVVEVRNQSIVTSGIYENFYHKNKKVIHHILDPQTGLPANSGLISATLIGDNPTQLDAFATAAIILGLQRSKELFQQYSIEGIFVTDQMQIYITEGLREKFMLFEKIENKKYRQNIR